MCLSKTFLETKQRLNLKFAFQHQDECSVAGLSGLMGWVLFAAFCKKTKTELVSWLRIHFGKSFQSSWTLWSLFGKRVQVLQAWVFPWHLLLPNFSCWCLCIPFPGARVSPLALYREPKLAKHLRRLLPHLIFKLPCELRLQSFHQTVIIFSTPNLLTTGLLKLFPLAITAWGLPLALLCPDPEATAWEGAVQEDMMPKIQLLLAVISRH